MTVQEKQIENLRELEFWEKLLKNNLQHNVKEGNMETPADLIIINAYNELKVEMKRIKRESTMQESA